MKASKYFGLSLQSGNADSQLRPSLPAANPSFNAVLEINSSAHSELQIYIYSVPIIDPQNQNVFHLVKPLMTWSIVEAFFSSMLAKLSLTCQQIAR